MAYRLLRNQEYRGKFLLHRHLPIGRAEVLPINLYFFPQAVLLFLPLSFYLLFQLDHLLASFRLSKCQFCSPGRKKKVRTGCSSQAPELHFVAENARVNNIKPEGETSPGFIGKKKTSSAKSAKRYSNVVQNAGRGCKKTWCLKMWCEFTGCNGYEYDAIGRRVYRNLNLRHPKRFFDYTSVGEGWHASPEHSIFVDFVSQLPIGRSFLLIIIGLKDMLLDLIAKIQASNVYHSWKQLAEALAVNKCVQM
ncbi:hypothetical protein Tco_0962772 [Tanacetum coccineum]